MHKEEMSLSSACLESFITKLLTDIGVSQDGITQILNGLTNVFNSYDKNKPDDTISSIVTSSISDFSSIARTSVDELFEIIVAQFVMSIIIVAVVVIMLSIVLVSTDSDTSFAACIVVLILFALSIAVLYWLGRVQAQSLAERTESSFKSTISSTYSRLVSYEEQQSKALSEAFCAY